MMSESSNIVQFSEHLKQSGIDATDEDFSKISRWVDQQTRAHYVSIKESIEDAISATNEGTDPDDISLLLEVIARLDATDSAEKRYVKRIDEKLGRSCRRELAKELEQIKSESRERERTRENTEQQERDGRTYVNETTMNFTPSVSLVRKALVRYGKDGNHLFSYGDEIARLEKRPDGTVSIRVLDLGGFKHECCKVIRWGRGCGEKEKRDAAPSDAIVGDVWNTQKGELGLNGLQAVASTPYFDADGNLISEPGYDKGSRIFYGPPNDFEMPNVPEAPASVDVEKAKDLLLKQVFVDFPFDDADGGQASLANNLAALLTMFVRPMISGHIPIMTYTKPMPGTGGSLIVETLHKIATGQDVRTQSEAKGEDEIRKNITAALMEGTPAYVLDNINGFLGSSALSNAATSRVWTDRLLGRNDKKIVVPNNAVFFFIGNNLKISDEIARRCCPIRLDSKQAKPTERTGFKIANLQEWTTEHRAELVWACLVLIQNWIAQGRKPSTAHLASFEDWARTLGGILEAAGIEGFLKNQKEFVASAAPDLASFDAFVQAWFNEFGDKPVKVGTKDRDVGSYEDIDRGLLWLITKNELDVYLGKSSNDEAQKATLGRTLSRKEGTRYHVTDPVGATIEVMLVKHEDVHRGNAYALQVVSKVDDVPE